MHEYYIKYFHINQYKQQKEIQPIKRGEDFRHILEIRIPSKYPTTTKNPLQKIHPSFPPEINQPLDIGFHGMRIWPKKISNLRKQIIHR